VSHRRLAGRRGRGRGRLQQDAPHLCDGHTVRSNPARIPFKPSPGKGGRSLRCTGDRRRNHARALLIRCAHASSASKGGAAQRRCRHRLHRESRGQRDPPWRRYAHDDTLRVHQARARSRATQLSTTAKQRGDRREERPCPRRRARIRTLQRPRAMRRTSAVVSEWSCSLRGQHTACRPRQARLLVPSPCRCRKRAAICGSRRTCEAGCIVPRRLRRGTSSLHPRWRGPLEGPSNCDDRIPLSEPVARGGCLACKHIRVPRPARGRSRGAALCVGARLRRAQRELLGGSRSSFA
jgi:hypothetical protein